LGVKGDSLVSRCLWWTGAQPWRCDSGQSIRHYGSHWRRYWLCFHFVFL